MLHDGSAPARTAAVAGLYPILDAAMIPASLREATLRELPLALHQAGVGILQYRNKQEPRAQQLADARLLRRHAPAGLRLIMNDDPALAVEAGFDGCHVGQGDTGPGQARAVLGKARLLGISTHKESQLRAAALEPVDYIAVGPVFPTSSKANPDPVIGLEGVRRARAATSLPLVAIGGITPRNAESVRQAGADAIAVISALFSCPDTPGTRRPEEIAADFLRVFK